MKQLLPEELVRSVLCQYTTSTWDLSPSQHLTHFSHWFAVAMGLSAPSSERSERSNADRDAKLLRQLPALKLLLPRVADRASSAEAGVAMDTSPDVDGAGVAMAVGCSLAGHRKTVALALHLVYEVH